MHTGQALISNLKLEIRSANPQIRNLETGIVTGFAQMFDRRVFLDCIYTCQLRLRSVYQILRLRQIDDATWQSLPLDLTLIHLRNAPDRIHTRRSDLVTVVSSVC